MKIVGVSKTVRQLFAVVFMILSLLSLWIPFCVQCEKTLPVYAQYKQRPQIIIDAGHGGFDGGAVGVNQVVEKDINLNISLCLAELLYYNGFDVIMTRSSDTALNDENETSISRKKRSDMYQRMAMMEQHPQAIFVSIHQNLFQDSSCKGAQIFYSTNHEASEQLAQKLQNGFREMLQPDNMRLVKAADKQLFLLDQAPIPAVLVECGFLSNPEECALLCDSTYQKQVAFVIYSALLNFCSV